MENLDSTFNYCSIEQLGLPKERYNADQSRIDNYGRRLLELCKSVTSILLMTGWVSTGFWVVKPVNVLL